MGDGQDMDSMKTELEEKNAIINEQAEKIRSLESELERVKRERDDLFKKFSTLRLAASFPDDTADDTR